MVNVIIYRCFVLELPFRAKSLNKHVGLEAKHIGLCVQQSTESLPTSTLEYTNKTGPFAE